MCIIYIYYSDFLRKTLNKTIKNPQGFYSLGTCRNAGEFS